LVCAGVLVLPAKEKIKGRFHLPYINGKIIFPVIFIGGYCFLLLAAGIFPTLMNWGDPKEGEFRASIFFFIIINLIFVWLPLSKIFHYSTESACSCLYLLTGMSHENWFWFGMWFLIGMVIYFFYGYKNSKLGKELRNN
jgi:hypothetical protein